MRGTIAAAASLAWLTACSGGEPPPEAQQTPSRADSVAIAEEAFDSTVFDTLSWETPEAPVERGSLVYRISCSKCHGDVGRGNARFVLQGDTLRPPSFLAADWRFAEDPMGLRRYIFHGNVAGMPYWGLVGLKYRDIDAVAEFILRFLRTNYPLT